MNNLDTKKWTETQYITNLVIMFRHSMKVELEIFFKYARLIK